jgi:uncharacterized DUF497 family protein
MDLGDAMVLWDAEGDEDGNVEHVADHGLTIEEVEDVLLNPFNAVGISRTSGRPITMGWTETGRYIHVIWEVVCDKPRCIKVRTAFEPDPGD